MTPLKKPEESRTQKKEPHRGGRALSVRYVG